MDIHILDYLNTECSEYHGSISRGLWHLSTNAYGEYDGRRWREGSHVNHR